MAHVLLLAWSLLASGAQHDTFDIRAELQGLYDEMSQATLQFVTASDVDEFHEVLYTPDWMFIDATGHSRPWTDVREDAVRALSASRPDSLLQSIQKLSVDPKGATVVVHLIAVHSIVDQEGRFGRPNAPHTLTDTTTFRDRWVRVAGEWKVTSRAQIGRPDESVDKPE